MRILFISPAFPPFPGGGERYTRSLALNLVQLGHAVTVLTSAARIEAELWQGCGERVTYEKDEGLEVICCPIRGLPGGWPMLLAWRKLMVLISLLPGDQTAVLQQMSRAIPPIQNLPTILRQLEGHFDLIHGFNISWEYPLIVGWRWAKQQHLPLVVTPFAHLGADGRDRVALNSTMDHQRRILSEAEAVFTLTTIEQRGLEGHGIRLKRATAVGSGLDPLPETAAFTPLQQQYQLTQPFVIFIGRNSYEKGAIHAAQAVLALRQQGSPISLVLVGQIAIEFKRFYGRLTETEKAGIRPLGILSEQEKHTLLKQAEILLLPSRTDSFGIVLLEAWAQDKPVIGARAGGIPGVIDHQKNGLLVNFGDVTGLAEAIDTLMKDDMKRQSMGENGRNKVHTQYTWNQVGERVCHTYEAIIQESSRARE
jgi:glycosyltransferase involved in cell wall biosynthesis